MLDQNSLEEAVEAVYSYTFEDFTLSEAPQLQECRYPDDPKYYF